MKTIIKDGIELYLGDSKELIKKLDSNSIDLTLTSPPYDKLRHYNGSGDVWGESVWKELISELYRVTATGGVVVWVVGDATVNGSETGTSFRQALYAMEQGFRLHDTMIYHKNALPKNHNRYEQDFEYMFVWSKGTPKTFNPIRVPCKFPEKETARQNSFYSETNEKNRSARSGKKRKPVGVDKIKGNIWYYTVGKNHSTTDEIAFKHPAIFPEKLAEDHIKSWTNEGDTVLDIFSGSGTVMKMSMINNRKFIGFEMMENYFDDSVERVIPYANNLECFI
ncbi:putative DNA methylase [Yersinia phage JC221]|nr:putative DNA methylase [Yersinia phage JC221]